MKGTFFSCVTRGSKRTIAKVYVAEDRKAGCLLSRETSMELGVLKLTRDVEEEEVVINQLTKGSKLNDIVEKFKGRVLNEPDGKVGKVKDFQLKLNIKEDIKPVVQRLRNTPFH